MEKFNKLYNNALKFLSFRSRSEKEVFDHLIKKEEAVEVITQVITKLKEQKFLNDYEFAKQWIESRMRFRPRSQKLLIFELKQKGISQEIIDTVINYEGLVINDLEKAKELVKKKIEKYKGLSRQEVFQKLGGFLARRGFDYDTIKASIDPDIIGVDEEIEKEV